MKIRRDMAHWRSWASLSVNETSFVTGLSPTTIHRLIRGRRLPVSKVGGRTLILPEDIARLIEEDIDEPL